MYAWVTSLIRLKKIRGVTLSALYSFIELLGNLVEKL